MRFKRTIAGLIAAIATALLWLWTGAKVMLDFLGRSSAVDDFSNPKGLVARGAAWLFATPWWAPFCLAALLTAILAWYLFRLTRLARGGMGGPPDIALSGAQPPQPSPQIINPLETYFSRKIIRLADLVQQQDYRIVDKVFEDCLIYGPALVALIEKAGTIEHCSFEGDVTMTFLVVPEGKRQIGVIGISGCRFSRCKFIGVGFIGPQGIIDQFSQGTK